jgi:chromosome segregation ATPase
MKVKDLLINDLIKKEQETKFNLDHLIVLYEQVKNARNKFVNLIQNCSQNLAEQKERIKILQNEYEILRNESAEKDHSLVEARHKLQKQRYIRDNKKAELEKLKKEHKELDSLTEQKITEQGKLSLVFATIEKEVKSLIERYEMACESRNMMGINLIDRNDELCILYEKANIQDSILKKGENSIHQKEEEIRMLNLELNERQRQILVLRKQIPEVPKLAREVNDLKTELDH